MCALVGVNISVCQCLDVRYLFLGRSHSRMDGGSTRFSVVLSREHQAPVIAPNVQRCKELSFCVHVFGGCSPITAPEVYNGFYFCAVLDTHTDVSSRLVPMCSFVPELLPWHSRPPRCTATDQVEQFPHFPVVCRYWLSPSS